VELHLKEGRAILLEVTIHMNYKGIKPWKATCFWPTAKIHIAITGGKALIDGRDKSLAMKVDSLFHMWKKIDSTHYNIRRKKNRAKLLRTTAYRNGNSSSKSKLSVLH